MNVDLDLGLWRNHTSDGVKASNYSLLFILFFPIELGRDIPIVREHYVPFATLSLNLLRDASIDAAQVDQLFVEDHQRLLDFGKNLIEKRAILGIGDHDFKVLIENLGLLRIKLDEYLHPTVSLDNDLWRVHKPQRVPI